MNLSYISFPKCSFIDFGFWQCSSLLSADLPECITMTEGTFISCYNLSEVSLPKCKDIGRAFQACSSLKSINLPECTSMSTAF